MHKIQPRKRKNQRPTRLVPRTNKNTIKTTKTKTNIHHKHQPSQKRKITNRRKIQHHPRKIHEPHPHNNNPIPITIPKIRKKSKPPNSPPKKIKKK